MSRILISALVAVLGAACANEGGAPPLPQAGAIPSIPLAAPSSAAPPGARDAAPDPPRSDRPPSAMSDRALGSLIDSASERTGDFPSDNFVSNETSVLHVIPELQKGALRGRAYVGVGPEQNYAYILVMQPMVAYIVDIRRQNMLQHLWIRAAVEQSATREQCAARLTGRAPLPNLGSRSVEAIAKAIERAPVDPTVVTGQLSATRALFTRLGVREMPGDGEALRKVAEAFSGRGLSLSYSMKGSSRRYPSLSELAGLRDDTGSAWSYLADDAAYASLRGMTEANRIVPVVGDLAGPHAMRAIAEDMAARGAVLGALYTSNVEQYLFEGGKFERFRKNVARMPHDEHSVSIRVWFNQGKAHPAERRGHRTTSVTLPVHALLAPSGYDSYWKLATARAP